jgi:hypothetical protein
MEVWQNRKIPLQEKHELRKSVGGFGLPVATGMLIIMLLVGENESEP